MSNCVFAIAVKGSAGGVKLELVYTEAPTTIRSEETYPVKFWDAESAPMNIAEVLLTKVADVLPLTVATVPAKEP